MDLALYGRVPVDSLKLDGDRHGLRPAPRLGTGGVAQVAATADRS
ncbi:hypothetical protein OHB00_34530 [Streptomyces sp. NBC_00631]